MQVVGYVRESPGDTGSGFSQGEAIRRWATRGGHQIVAVFQDVPGDRTGYETMLRVLPGSSVDTVVVAGIESLSPDLISQEIMIWHIRAIGIGLTSTEPEEARLLAQESTDQTRNLVRHVLAKRDAHDRLVEPDGDTAAVLDPAADGVLIEFVEAAAVRAS